MVDKLYELIGGNRTIWAATDLFYSKILQDKELKPFFDATDMAHLRAKQSMFISMLLGGRVVYTGKEITTAHARVRKLGLTDAHFDAFLRYFREALLEVGVQPDKVQQSDGIA